MAPTKPASLKVRALQWLAQREHSPVELRGKLMRLALRAASADQAASAAHADLHDGAQGGAHGDAQDAARDDGTRNTALSSALADSGASVTPSTADEVEAVMAWLSAHGYLSQQRFVESRVHARQARFGNLRITRELQQHGVKLDADAQQALRASEYERASDVWQRKYGSGGPPHDAAARVRQMRFLAGRGFSPEVIRRVLRGPAADD